MISILLFFLPLCFCCFAHSLSASLQLWSNAPLARLRDNISPSQRPRVKGRVYFFKNILHLLSLSPPPFFSPPVYAPPSPPPPGGCAQWRHGCPGRSLPSPARLG